MKVVVLIAGVVDPKWRLERLGLRAGTEQPDETGLPRRLSPFDEAALEIALKLRDANPSVHVTAVVIGDAGSDALLRAVMALRPHRALRVDRGDASPWDSAAMARQLGAAADAIGAPDLVLIGREFGDGDDGTLPPLLAEMRGATFCGQALSVVLADDAFVAKRMRGPREEILRLVPPALASVTNDRGNRLRHALMKNVVLAKRDAIDVVAVPRDDATRRVHARALAVVPSPRRGAGTCRILDGPIDDQIAELAAYLDAWRAP